MTKEQTVEYAVIDAWMAARRLEDVIHDYPEEARAHLGSIEETERCLTRIVLSLDVKNRRAA